MSAAPRIAFVASGGAVKAYAFHVGVLQGLEEDGFSFRGGLRWQPTAAPAGAREICCYVGSSAGACIAASLASGHPPEDLKLAILGRHPRAPRFGYRTLFVPVMPNPLRYAQKLRRRWRLGGVRPRHLIDAGGLLTSAGVEKYFRRHVLPTNRFADLSADLFLAATQVNSARKVVFGPRDSLEGGGYGDCAYYDNVRISQAIAAAISMPPLFAPYGIANATSGNVFHYYDGEVRETLSAHIARDNGADFIIASSIWSPYRYDARVGSLADLGMTAVAEQALHQAIEQKVDRDRQQTAAYERLLRLIDEHGREHRLPAEATEQLAQRARELLGHRSTETLYVVPDPRDHEFFFDSFFRFGERLIDRCVAAGYRAYQRGARDNPRFFEALDRALQQRSADGQRLTDTP